MLANPEPRQSYREISKTNKPTEESEKKSKSKKQISQTSMKKIENYLSNKILLNPPGDEKMDLTSSQLKLSSLPIVRLNIKNSIEVALQKKLKKSLAQKSQPNCVDRSKSISAKNYINETETKYESKYTFKGKMFSNPHNDEKDVSNRSKSKTHENFYKKQKESKPKDIKEQSQIIIQRLSGKDLQISQNISSEKSLLKLSSLNRNSFTGTSHQRSMSPFKFATQMNESPSSVLYQTSYAKTSSPRAKSPFLNKTLTNTASEKNVNNDFEILQNKMLEVESKIMGLKKRKTEEMFDLANSIISKTRKISEDCDNTQTLQLRKKKKNITGTIQRSISPTKSRKNISLEDSSILKLQNKKNNKIGKDYFYYYISPLIRIFVDKLYNENEIGAILFMEHFAQTIASLKYASQHFEMVNIENLCQFNLPPTNKKTLVFDLDETLIHSVQGNVPNCDFVIDIINSNNVASKISVFMRPYLKETLEHLNKFYDIVVFTASHENYANAILDIIDSERTIIKNRVCRDYCIYTNEGVFIKDLRVLRNRDLSEMVLVDNASYSFSYQIKNGIPIIPFYDDPNDKELLHLSNYLVHLKDQNNIVDFNWKYFKFDDYLKYSEPGTLLKEVYHRHMQ